MWRSLCLVAPIPFGTSANAEFPCERRLVLDVNATAARSGGICRRRKAAARFVIRPMLAKALSKHGRTLFPRGVRDTPDRSNSLPPSSRSSFLMPMLKDGCETRHRFAACEKLRSCTRATKYLIWAICTLFSVAATKPTAPRADLRSSCASGSAGIVASSLAPCVQGE